MNIPPTDTVCDGVGNPPVHEQDENNCTMLQGFEWYCPNDQKHWKRLQKTIPSLSALGITSIWIPPATKELSKYGNGYGIYDLWDLGEFDQKGSIATKWGTKTELVGLVECANAHGISIIFDAVLNHKAGADHTEMVKACKVDPQDRTKDIGKPELIEAWTGFDFKGRGGKYSSMRWNKEHFTGVDVDNKSKAHAIWRFSGKEWAGEVDNTSGNSDYLMFSDIDHKHPEVREDLFNWVQWLSTQMKLGGLRLDAVRHYSGEFLRDLLLYVDKNVDSNWFFVGEYWRDNSKVLARYIEYMGGRISLFDVNLLLNFSRLSLEEKADLRTVFEDSLASLKPQNAVIFVTNHDTQKGRTLETTVAPYFIPIAYALILLKKNAGLPCVFYGDLYGCFVDDHSRKYQPPGYGGNIIPKLILMRRLYAYGDETLYMDDPNCIGLSRLGASSHSAGAGLAVIINNDWKVRTKMMSVGKNHAGENWTDVLRWCPGEVLIDSNGYGTFYVGPRSVSVWVSRNAANRDQLDNFVFDWDIYKLKDLAAAYPEVQKTDVKNQLKDTMPGWLQSEESESSDEASDPNQKDLGLTTKAQCQTCDKSANKKKEDADNDEDCIVSYTDSGSSAVDISREGDLIAREK